MKNIHPWGVIYASLLSNLYTLPCKATNSSNMFKQVLREWQHKKSAATKIRTQEIEISRFLKVENKIRKHYEGTICCSYFRKLCPFFDNTISYIHDEGIVNQYNLAVSYTFLLLKFFINFALFLMTRQMLALKKMRSMVGRMLMKMTDLVIETNEYA